MGAPTGSSLGQTALDELTAEELQAIVEGYATPAELMGISRQLAKRVSTGIDFHVSMCPDER